MVLEPVASPRVGQALNLIAALVLAGATLTTTTIGSVSGVVPIATVGALLATGFLIRFVGLTIARSRRSWTMDWLSRILSWIAFGTATTLVAIIGAARLMFVFGAFVAIDCATAFVKREVKEPAPKPKPARSLWQRIRFPLFTTLYLGAVVAFHLLVGAYLPYGVLITWSLLALGFCLVLRGLLIGDKADEAWLHAPKDHRRHERKLEPVADPQRERAEAVLQALHARGDASGLLEFVRTAARDAGLGAADVAQLEERILASLARPGTKRSEDVEAALQAIERSLSPRSIKEIRPS